MPGSREPQPLAARGGEIGAASNARGPGFLRNAMIDSTTALFVVAFAFQLAGTALPLVVAGTSYVLAIGLGAAVRWGIAVYLFPPGSLILDPEPPSRDLP